MDAFTFIDTILFEYIPQLGPEHSPDEINDESVTIDSEHNPASTHGWCVVA